MGDSVASLKGPALPPATTTSRVQFCEEQNTLHDSPWILFFDRTNNNSNKDSNNNNSLSGNNSSHHVCTPDFADMTKIAEQANPGMRVLSQKAVWYQQGDVMKFKHEVQVYARMVMTREQHSKHMSKSDLNYCSLHNNSNSLSKNSSHHSTKSSPPLSDNHHEHEDDPSWSDALWNAYQGLYRALHVDEMNNVMARAKTQSVDPLCVGLEKWALPQLRSMRSRQRRALVQAVVSRQTTDSPKHIRKLARELSRPSRLFAIYLARAVHEAVE